MFKDIRQIFHINIVIKFKKLSIKFNIKLKIVVFSWRHNAILLAFLRSPTQDCLTSKFQNHSIKLDSCAIEIRKGIFYSAAGFWVVKESLAWQKKKLKPIYGFTIY